MVMTDKKRILYIEDDPGSQILVQRTLTHAGYKVVLASRGIEGLDLASREMPDLILMDINLPDLSGREVTTRLRADERFRSVPIVALSAQSQAGEREKGYVAGVTGYLTKPIDVDTLPKLLENYLAGAKDLVTADALNVAQQAYNQEIVSRLEQKLREMEANNAELRRLDKMKEDFIQLTAHELRTPMTLIYGYSRLMQDSTTVRKLKEENAEFKGSMDGLLDAIERMSTVINEIVTISRIATGRIELSVGPVHPVKIAQDVVHNYTQAVRNRNQTISLDTRGWPNLIQADHELITLALSNLIGNAIKYTPDGGTISIGARSAVNTLTISVQDTGIGINREDRDRIFDRFYTASNTQLHSTSKTAFRGGGLGLGLAICRGIIEAHGGRIWVESEGRDEERMPGSTFFLEIPFQARTTSPRRAV